MKSFALAPMDNLMTALTVLVLALPLSFVATSLSAPPVTLGLGAVGVLLVGVYTSIWLGARPSRFEVSDAELSVKFPVWTRTFPLSTVQSVEVYPGNRFRQDVGWGMRVGAGGLWGGFGLLVCSDQTFEMYVSRVSDLVVVRLEGRRPLLISPDDIQLFAEVLEPRIIPHVAGTERDSGG